MKIIMNHPLFHDKNGYNPKSGEISIANCLNSSSVWFELTLELTIKKLFANVMESFAMMTKMKAEIR